MDPHGLRRLRIRRMKRKITVLQPAWVQAFFRSNGVKQQEELVSTLHTHGANRMQYVMFHRMSNERTH